MRGPEAIALSVEMASLDFNVHVHGFTVLGSPGQFPKRRQLSNNSLA
jgi:hypothetical protein